MRLVIFTNRDLPSNLFLNLLLPHLGKYVVHIFLSDAVGGKTVPAPELQALKFVEQTLPNDILFPQIESQNPKTTTDKYLTFNTLSQKYNVPISSLNNVRSAESLARIQALNPDLVLSVRYGKIFGNEFIKIPKLGVINLHSGLLPNYRGVLATFRALQHGDTEIGTTLHYIEDATIDTGSIIATNKIAVDPQKCLFSHILRLYPSSVNSVVEAVETLFSDQKVSTYPQSNETGAYYSFPTSTDIQSFLAKGHRFIDYQAYTEFIKQYFE